jgi:hypothetical protein
MMVMHHDDSFERQWMAQWRAAGPALAKVREVELARLSDAEALAAADMLLAIAVETPLPAERVTWSGLVELQRLLRRAR